MITWNQQNDAEAKRYAEVKAHEELIEAALSEYIAAEIAAAAKAQPKPKKIRFEGSDCRRCDGLGRSLHWGLSNNTCYACQGAGFFLSEAGKEARQAYDRAIDEAVATARAAGATTYPKRSVMKKIAAQYPGATLVY